MFNIFTAAKRNKELEQERESLNKQVADLEYQLADKKSALKFFRESEKRKCLEVSAEQRENKKLKKGNRELRGEISGLKSQLREQNDADLLLIALQESGLVLSKGAVDKYVSDEGLAEESVRKRMNNKGVKSPLDDLRRSDRDNLSIAHQAALASQNVREGCGTIRTSFDRGAEV